MKVTCPKDPKHDRFVTTQHVMEHVVVDNDGEFVDVLEQLEVSSKPEPGNLFTCRECESEAKAEW